MLIFPLFQGIWQQHGTKTGGYIANAEIRDILFKGEEPQYTDYTEETWHDDASNSDILVCNDVEWVAWMSDTTKETRTDWYKSLNFGGTSDWAVDLDRDCGNCGNSAVGEQELGAELGGGPVCDKAGDYDTLEMAANYIHLLKNDYEISNPKAIVDDAMGNVSSLDSELTARIFDLGMGLWLGNDGEVVQSLAMPVFLIQNAVEGMDQAKEIGEEVEEAEAKNILLTILSIIFLVVPFLGELAAVAAGLSNLARAIAIAGIAGNAGLGIQDIIKMTRNIVTSCRR